MRSFCGHYDNHGGQNRPNAMVLCYPVITADEFAHEGSIRNVSGCQPGTPGYEYFSLDKHVLPGHLPGLFVGTPWRTDCVPVENSLKMLAALHNAGVPAEAHFFPHGCHGMSVCTQETGSPDPYNARWMDLCLDWLTTPLAISCNAPRWDTTEQKERWLALRQGYHLKEKRRRILLDTTPFSCC